jgi:FkbH-like protein
VPTSIASSTSTDPFATCTHVGAGVQTRGEVIVSNAGQLEIGDAVTLDGRAAPITLTTGEGGVISIGARTTIEFGVRITARNEVRVGDGVRLGPQVTIDDSDGTADGRRIEIGARAVVGAGVVIGPGARIAPGQVVPAGVVVRSQPKAVAKTAASVGVPRSTGVVIADFTAEDVASALRASDGYDPLELDVQVAPLGQVVQTLHALAGQSEHPDFALIWTRPDAAINGFRMLMEGISVDAADILAEVDAFAAQIRAQAEAARFVFVASWALTPDLRGLGMLDLRAGGIASTLMRMNLRLAEQLEGANNVFLLDAQRWVSSGGLADVKPKRWFLGKISYGAGVFAEAARDVRAALRGARGMARKLIVVDLDDTLWGGIVGDVGWEGLRLGGHDVVGEAHIEFQRQLVALSRRGIALAVVSKNEEGVALEAMRSHPEMLIKPEQLASYRINWRDKAANIVEIAEELNLGLQSVVFLDDNRVERGRVREALPEVFVPEWPADPTLYALTLASLRCFDSPRISAEDRERNSMYATERVRTAQREQYSSLDSWLESLDVRVRFDRLSPQNLARATQLLNKTNQMNLRTRRLSEVEFLRWSELPGNEVWAASVSDRFGDSGLTGLIGISSEGTIARVEDFVLSCRVMGRRVEDAMTWLAATRARAAGATTLIAELVPSKKNMPCRRYLDESALARDPSSELTYVAQLGDEVAKPAAVAIEGELD